MIDVTNKVYFYVKKGTSKNNNDYYALYLKIEENLIFLTFISKNIYSSLSSSK